MTENFLEKCFKIEMIPQMIQDKDKNRYGGFYIRDEDGDYLTITYRWAKDGIYEAATLQERG